MGFDCHSVLSLSLLAINCATLTDINVLGMTNTERKLTYVIALCTFCVSKDVENIVAISKKKAQDSHAQ